LFISLRTEPSQALKPHHTDASVCARCLLPTMAHMAHGRRLMSDSTQMSVWESLCGGVCVWVDRSGQAVGVEAFRHPSRTSRVEVLIVLRRFRTRQEFTAGICASYRPAFQTRDAFATASPCSTSEIAPRPPAQNGGIGTAARYEQRLRQHCSLTSAGSTAGAEQRFGHRAATGGFTPLDKVAAGYPQKHRREPGSGRSSHSSAMPLPHPMLYQGGGPELVTHRMKRLSVTEAASCCSLDRNDSGTQPLHVSVSTSYRPSPS
jgi:hypothetical protein